MGLRDMLKRKDRLAEDYSADAETQVGRLAAPEFKFIRSDTNTQEVIYPPVTPIDDTRGQHNDSYLTAKDSSNINNNNNGNAASTKPRRSLDVFSRSRGSSVSSAKSEQLAPKKDGVGRRLSHRMHLGRQQPESSEYVPENLPQIRLPGAEGDDAGVDKDVVEREWENRATMLAQQNGRARSLSRSATTSPAPPELPPLNLPSDSDNYNSNNYNGNDGGNRGAPSKPKADGKAIDEAIQEAIRLHEEGSLEQSTELFGRLADPEGANNPLSQVLYGLALRHGWGCEPDPARAVNFLSAAASNAAVVENMALKAGLKKGGALKGELVLAIFELANCFRHGWGIPKDAVAAKQYYETAANLGDTDAMNEVAWCYLEGFGCKKDKYAAAKYYRLAEKNGNKTLGNSWIWKDKYNPTNGGKK